MKNEIDFIKSQLVFLEGVVIGTIRGDKQLAVARGVIDDIRKNFKVFEAIAHEFVEPCPTCHLYDCTCPEPTPETEPLPTITIEPLPTKYTTLQDFLKSSKDISK